MTDIAKGMKLSRERVRQLEARLTGRLRTYLTEELGDAVEVG